jgi:homoserine dehydrogenase
MSSRRRAPGAVPANRSSSRRVIRLGLIGFGTVGTGTVKVLLDHQREIERRLGFKMELKTICSRSIHRGRISWLGRPVHVTRDWKRVVGDPGLDVVIELVDTPAAARAIAFAALRAGKHLVTANKQLVAEHGAELAERAGAARLSLGIEACVAGGTPVLHAIREGLASEDFTALYGILNGTTNYILTEMESRGCSFAEALAEAQKHGYAESDPTLDIRGLDARYKIAILTMLSFGQAVRVGDIPAEGIERVESIDFTYARHLNHTLRLIAAARKRPDGRVEAFVRPMMIPCDAPLAAVRGATNGVLLVGSKGGNTLITGRGAGGEPTGVAVLSDVVEIARTIAAGGTRTSPLGYTRWRPARPAPPEDGITSAYLRLVVRDRTGIIARVGSILARHGINIGSVLQEPGHPKERLPFVMTLEPARADRLRRAARHMARLPFLVQAPFMIPFADLP